MKKKTLFLVLMLILAGAGVLWAQATDPGTAPIQPYVKAVQGAKEGMTLLQILQSGGVVMILHGIISFLMLSLVLYMFVRLNPRKLVPPEHTDRVVSLIKSRSYSEARAQCLTIDNLTSSIALAGLERVNESAIPPAEASELAARKEIAGLWNSLSYLSDIAQIAPMLGLLGTVFGMIQAFNTIAFDAGVVKPLMLAGGVAKAMITTAAGLAVAITAMTFYSILKVRVLNLANHIEAATSQIMEAFSR